jgi:uncharacterized protein (DUF169 family)
LPGRSVRFLPAIEDRMTLPWHTLHRQLTDRIGDTSPVAVAYRDDVPEGLEPFTGTVPSGCTFWRLAAEGRAFYTTPEDHYNCPIGSYTHAIDLPASRSGELEQTLSLMAGLGYVRMEEVPAIPRLPRTPRVTCYAPLAQATFSPDLVIFSGRPGPLMRLHEAALRAGAASSLPLLGRPTCMALPAALAHGAVMSTGCIGNRVYTGIGEDELYLMLPGARLADVAAEVEVVTSANDALARYHAERRELLGAPA